FRVNALQLSRWCHCAPPVTVPGDRGGLGNLPESSCGSMKSFRRVGSYNPLSFLHCRTPSTGTIPSLSESSDEYMLRIVAVPLSAFTGRVYKRIGKSWIYLDARFRYLQNVTNRINHILEKPRIYR
ncbi:MAG TPA: hypothetical protein VNY79_09900, partial [Xanthobacteraceae bacterium]|nr:hypothetical protein [Xanthobacteraceae bacterium]